MAGAEDEILLLLLEPKSEQCRKLKGERSLLCSDRIVSTCHPVAPSNRGPDRLEVLVKAPLLHRGVQPPWHGGLVACAVACASACGCSPALGTGSCGCCGEAPTAAGPVARSKDLQRSTPCGSSPADEQCAQVFPRPARAA